MGELTFLVGDLTQQRVEAIVHAANSSLLGGCETGDAKPTTAGSLPANWVLHAVGPVWRGGGSGDAELLASAHRRSLEVAEELGARSLAFPAISCGIYGYPPEEAAPVAVDAVRPFLERYDEIRFVFLDERLRDVFATRATP